MSSPKGNEKQCSKFVVVLGSEPARSGPDGSNPLRCNCLRNIVESEIFRTGQKSVQVYESAALTAELRALRHSTFNLISICDQSGYFRGEVQAELSQALGIL